MKNNNRMINEIIAQFYQDEKLLRCVQEEINIQPQRLNKLYEIIMNYDKMSEKEIKEQVYHYAESIQEEELLARQIFLCLIRLLEM